MKNIQQVAEGAFFVKSYSEQTIISSLPAYLNQTGIFVVGIEDFEKDADENPDFDNLIDAIIDERRYAWETLSDL